MSNQTNSMNMQTTNVIFIFLIKKKNLELNKPISNEGITSNLFGGMNAPKNPPGNFFITLTRELNFQNS